MKESPPSHVPGTGRSSSVRHPCRHLLRRILPSPARRIVGPAKSVPNIKTSVAPSLSPPQFLAKESQRSTPTERLRAVSSLLWEKVPGQPFKGQFQQRTAIKVRPRTTPTPSCTPLPSALCCGACRRLLATARHQDDDTSPSVVCARQLEDLRCDGGGTWIRCPAAQCEGFLVQFVVIAIACPALAR